MVNEPLPVPHADDVPLGPKLRLGPHIPEAPLRPQAKPRTPLPTDPEQSRVEIALPRLKDDPADQAVWHATKQSFEDIPSQAELSSLYTSLAFHGIVRGPGQTEVVDTAEAAPHHFGAGGAVVFAA